MEHDQGSETQQRYRIQAGLAALYALNMLEDGSAVVAISVESGEDFVEERNDGSFVYCQVKTRLIDRGAFPFGDKDIRDALANFVVADRISSPGSIRKFALISNVGHRPSQDHKIDAEEFLNYCSDPAFLGSIPSQKMAQKIAKRATLVLGRLDNGQSPVTVDEVRQVMNRVSLRVERFELGFIDHLVEHVLRNSRFASGIARDAIPEMAKRLIDRLVSRSAKGEELHIPGSIPLAEDFKTALAARRTKARSSLAMSGRSMCPTTSCTTSFLICEMQFAGGSRQDARSVRALRVTHLTMRRGTPISTPEIKWNRIRGRLRSVSSSS
jgi:hypothetical protein